MDGANGQMVSTSLLYGSHACDAARAAHESSPFFAAAETVTILTLA
jgi:hypothetical protein